MNRDGLPAVTIYGSIYGSRFERVSGRGYPGLMPTIQKHTPGTFCWWELGTPDLEAAWRFYHTLFRWEKRDVPVGGGPVYRICVLEGQDVCALYQLDPGQAAGAPGWMPYLAVENADAAAQAAAQAGATVLQQPFDVFDSGRMALLLDPEGARLAVWEPKQHRGAGMVREIGAVDWCELAAQDPERARRFYSAAFAWKPKLTAGPAGEYTYWHVGGETEPVGGMLQLSGGAQSAGWKTYFRVADCDEFAPAAAAAFGKVLAGPFDAGERGRVVVVEDPGGGVFTVREANREQRTANGQL